MVSPDILSVSNSAISQQIVKRMEREASYKYQKITLPEENAANMLYVNGTLIHRSPNEIQHSYKVNDLDNYFIFSKKIVYKFALLF